MEYWSVEVMEIIIAELERVLKLNIEHRTSNQDSVVTDT
jgi:hypothetical protein